VTSARPATPERIKRWMRDGKIGTDLCSKNRSVPIFCEHAKTANQEETTPAERRAAMT
jgi:hypothetical protein